ncbi:hypothetical protein EVG20_g10246 [Dentipellis fragilis]|uniref:Uncharacterized protein n=1 Tax=Dentipellis fragilis TaxID=205917 RepID=A0A4Y9XTQ2_9AGAM|nr:hypothetical protein EVG20_g10246 [Dentipellis fragilis]
MPRQAHAHHVKPTHATSCLRGDDLMRTRAPALALPHTWCLFGAAVPPSHFQARTHTIAVTQPRTTRGLTLLALFPISRALPVRPALTPSLSCS